MTKAYLSAVGGRIRSLREAAGMTQREFADAAGLNVKYASRLELGLQNITIVSLGRTALALKVPVASLLEGVEADPELLSAKPRANARPRRARVLPAAAAD